MWQRLRVAFLITALPYAERTYFTRTYFTLLGAAVPPVNMCISQALGWLESHMTGFQPMRWKGKWLGEAWGKLFEEGTQAAPVLSPSCSLPPGAQMGRPLEGAGGRDPEAGCVGRWEEAGSCWSCGACTPEVTALLPSLPMWGRTKPLVYLSYSQGASATQGAIKQYTHTHTHISRFPTNYYLYSLHRFENTGLRPHTQTRDSEVTQFNLRQKLRQGVARSLQPLTVGHPARE